MRGHEGILENEDHRWRLVPLTARPVLLVLNHALKLAGKVVGPISRNFHFERAVTGISTATVLAVVLLLSRSPQASSPAPIWGDISAIDADQYRLRIFGVWGEASYQNPNDQMRTEAAARSQCTLPYVITAGIARGVTMHLADEATPQDLLLNGSPNGKNYIGPPGPAGGERGRETFLFAAVS
jgi:hypothetical protein